jgi:small subunit ribosomal protein S20
MPNTKSAIKRARQAEKRTEHNKAQRSRLKTAIKRTMTATDAETAEASFRETSALLDRYATRNLVHKNKAARKKSQLAKHVATLRGEG